jgi:hypothetical protein
MAIAREIDLTWQGASKPFVPSITSIVRIENAVRKATERPDFSIAEVLMRIDKDPVMFAVVWGAMLTLAGHVAPEDVKPADTMEYFYQGAWEALTKGVSDPHAMQDLTSARDAIFQMVAPSVDVGKPPAPLVVASGAAKKKKASQ